MKTAKAAKGGFTLVELLVVIGVIALITTGVTFSLRGGTQAQSLQAGQGALISLLSTARAQAATSQRQAAILIWGDENDSDRYLRHAAVGLLVDPVAKKWEVKGEGIYLPSGIFFVPPDASATGPAKLANPTDWEEGTTTVYKTLADPESAELITLQRFNTGTGSYEDIENVKAYVTVRYTLIGQLATGENQLVVAVGEHESDSVIRFDSAELIRGVYLSVYGIPIIINEKLGFKKN